VITETTLRPDNLADIAAYKHEGRLRVEVTMDLDSHPA
jgi:hypothetical protein